MSEYHNPVMLRECIEGLAIKADGIYVDITFGGGGHSKEILKHLGEKGKLYAFDQDDEARLNAEAIDNRSFTFVQTNFRNLKKYLASAWRKKGRRDLGRFRCFISSDQHRRERILHKIRRPFGYAYESEARRIGR